MSGVPKKIDQNSASACHSGLELFSLKPTQVAIQRSQFKELLPLNTLHESPYEFKLHSDSTYIDLNRTYLYLKLSIEKLKDGEWEALKDGDKVAPVQNIGSSFIKQMRVQIGGNDVYQSGNLYPFLSYITNEINLSSDYKDTVLQQSGYYTDEVNQNSETNQGHLARMKMCKKGKTFETLTKLTFDLANQKNFLLNNLQILFIFYQSDDRFLIKNYTPSVTDTYRIKVHSIKMYVRTIEAQPSVNLSLMKMLEKQPAIYNTKKLQIRSTYLTKGKTEVN